MFIVIFLKVVLGDLGMKSVIVRLDDELFKEFDRLCKECGYAEQGLIRRLIRELVFKARVNSLRVEESLPDEVEALEGRQRGIAESEVIDWEKIKIEL